MARAHGRFARLYIEQASGGSASPLSGVGSWEINLSSDRAEVTALTDTNKTYVTGLPDGTLTFAGFLDDTAGASTLAAALDGVARKVYAYPFSSDVKYIAGTFFLDGTIGTDVNGPVTTSGSGSPASAIIKVGL